MVPVNGGADVLLLRSLRYFEDIALTIYYLKPKGHISLFSFK